MAGMKISFQLLLSIMFISTVSLRVTKIMIFVNDKKTWKDAQLYCQNKYIDLISLLSYETDDLAKLVGRSLNKVWIGLNRDPSNIEEWSWTETREDNSSIHFKSNHRGLDCAYIIPSSETPPSLSSSLCSTLYPYYCASGIQARLQLASWDGAKETCGELSSVKESTVDEFPEVGWVGLRRAADGNWKWTGEPSVYYDWLLNHPKNTDCAAFMVKTEAWLAYPCHDHYGFVCYSDNLVLIKEEKTWEEALQHCRDLGGYDLLSSQYDHRYVHRHAGKAVTDEVWIGLRFLAGEWRWMDWDKMEQQGLPQCAPQGKHCGTRHKHDSTLEIRDCMEKRNFICFKMYNVWMSRPYPIPIA